MIAAIGHSQDLINRSEDRMPLSDLTGNSPFLSGRDTELSKKETKKKVDGSLKELIKDKRHLHNLLLLLFLWVASAFDYYLINFQLKYIEGDIYTNTIVSSVSEVTAYLVSGALYEKIGTKVSFVGSFIIAAIGSIFQHNILDHLGRHLQVVCPLDGPGFQVRHQWFLQRGLSCQWHVPSHLRFNYLRSMQFLRQTCFNVRTTLRRVPKTPTYDYLLHHGLCSWRRRYVSPH